MPAENIAVSTLPEIQLMFSEELNDPQPSDFVFTGGDLGMSIISVSKVDRYTYKLLTNRNPIIGGILDLSFPNLKDYNGNKITNGTVSFLIDLTIPVDTIPNHYGVSTGGYPSISVAWKYTYTPLVASNTYYRVKLTTGSTDCNTGTAVTPVTSDATVNVTPLVSGTTYNFSIDTSVITSLGAQVILVCVDNDTNNKHGTGFVNIVRDDTAPIDVALTPVGGNYVSPQTLTFSCTDNGDRVIYNYASNVASGVDPVAGAITEPSFNTTTGAVISGTVYDPQNKPTMPYGGDTTRTLYKYRCIDKAGNITPPNASPALLSGVYRINSTFPTVTLTSLTKTGATPAVTIGAVGAGGHTSATLQWSTNQVGQSWEIRSGGSDCGVGGVVVASGSGGTATPSPANTPILTTILNTSPGIIDQTFNDLRVCVTNGTDWGQAGFTLLRDDSAPSALTVNVPPASYGSAQNLVFSCSDNADRVVYTESFSTPTATPADPGDPTFDADGRLLFGTVQSTPLAVTTDSTALVGKKTRVKWRCIDKAGHVTAVNDATYTIDTLLPTVTVQTQDRTAISSQAGAYNSAQLTWVADRQISGYDIRRGSTNCTDGTILSSGTNLSGASVVSAGTSITSTINAVGANFPSGDGAYTIHICTWNSIGNKGYSSRTLSYDNVVPNVATPSVSISAVDSTNFTLTWTSATDPAPASGIAGYRIYRSSASNSYPNYPATPTYIATSSPATIAMPDTNPYFLKIVPFDTAGNMPALASAYTETATNLSITVVVTGYTAGYGPFSVQQGAETLNFSTAPGGTQSFTATFFPGSTYSVQVAAQPDRQNCAFTGDQYGTVNSNVTLQVTCVPGYLRSGAMTSNKPIALNYHLYRGNATLLAGGGSGTACPGSNTANCFDGVGTAARFSSPHGMAIVNGVIYIADRENNRIRKYDIATNTTSTFAGEGSPATTDGTGTSARINKPQGITSDGVNLFVTESPSAPAISYIRRINIATQQVTTIAGGASVAGGVSCPGTVQATCRDGSAFQALFGLPNDIDYHSGHLYISEYGNNRVRRMNLATGQVETIAGNGTAASVDDTTGTSASFNGAAGLTLLGNSIYVVDYNGHRVRTISLTAPHAVGSLVGTGVAGHADGPYATARFANPDHIFADARDLYVTEYGANRLRRINLAKNTVSTIAGSGGATDAGGVGPAAAFGGPVGIVSDGARLFVATYNGGRLFRVSDAGLVGSWQIEPGVSPNDYSSDNTSVLNGSVSGGSLSTLTDRFGNANGASLFNGAGHQIMAATTGLPTGNAPRTMCAWVKPTSAPTGNHIIATYGTTAVNQSFGLFSSIASGVENVGLTAYGSDLIIPHTLSTTKWTHLCAWANGTTGRVYLNGKILGSYAHTFATGATGMRIGAQQGDLQYFGGGIADVRIYSRALSEGEINELAQNATAAEVGQTFSTGGTGLIMHYTLANSVAAQGPVGVTLSLAGTGGTSITGKDGAVAGAMYYDGGGYHYTTAYAGLPVGNAPRTHCGWVRPANKIATGQYFTLLQYGLNGTNQKAGLWLRDNAGVKKLVNGGGGNDHEVNFDFPINTWIHVCNTYDGTNSSLYANGQLLGTAAFPAWDTQQGALGIGRDLPTSGFLTGGLQDIRIYNNALSANQIRELATQVPEGLVLRLDTNGDLNDVSGFGHGVVSNPGTLVAGRRGVANTAYRFVGPTQAQISHAPELMQQADISWSFWMKSPDMTNINAQIIGKYVPTPNSGWVIKYDPISFAHGWTVGTAGTGADGKSHPVPSNNVWNHYAFVRSGAGWLVYINGVNFTSASGGNGTAIIPNTVNLSIGNNGTGEVHLQDVRIYNRAITGAEVQALAGYHVVQSVGSMNLHMQADTLSNLSDGNAVTGTWKNSVIQATLGPNATAAGNPRFVTGASSLLGGMPAIEFDGAAGKYFDFGFPTFSYAGLTVCTAATRKTNGYRGLIEKRGAVAANNSWGMLNDLPSNALKFEMDSTASAEVVNAIADDTPAIYCVISSTGNLLSSYVNGQAGPSVGKTMMSGSNSDRLVVGARFDLASSYYGQIGEVFVMSKDASAAERRIAECYLSAKFSIPLVGGAVCP
ncbi:MAG: LamG-like jellyroll fold domain-containing protein [Turneriella sp.]